MGLVFVSLYEFVSALISGRVPGDVQPELLSPISVFSMFRLRSNSCFSRTICSIVRAPASSAPESAGIPASLTKAARVF